MAFDEEQSALVEDLVLYSFLAIGVVGLVTLPGVWLLKAWGFWGTVALSAYAVVFDVWAFLAIQPSAAAGVIPAVVIAGFLVLMRRDLLSSR